MDLTLINQNATVDTVVRIVPDASRIFMKHKTICVGCPLARFCTLGEVATVYGFDLQSLLNDLEKSFTAH